MWNTFLSFTSLFCCFLIIHSSTFFHSLTDRLTHLSTPSLTCSFIHPLIHSRINLLTHSHLFTPLCIYSFIHWFVYSLVYSVIHSLTAGKNDWLVVKNSDWCLNPDSKGKFQIWRPFSFTHSSTWNILNRNWLSFSIHLTILLSLSPISFMDSWCRCQCSMRCDK